MCYNQLAMTDLDKTHKDEQRWLLGVQKRLKKYISHWKWDCILLSSTQYDIISKIMSVNDVNELPMMINERIVTQLFEQIDFKFKQVKQAHNRSDFNF